MRRQLIGTGGTISGTGRYLKEVSGGRVKIIGADPEGSVYSGGRGRPYLVEGVGEKITEIGSTIDDAAGEAYDKVARILDLPYPGGPPIDKMAEQGSPDAIAFPRGLTGPRDSRHDFSFSGLKTAVARWVEQRQRAAEEIPVADVCASFQEAVADVLTMKAVREAEDLGVDTLVISGGVAANSRLSALAAQRCADAGITLRVPRPRLCTDNGAMIAALGAHVLASGAQPSPLPVAFGVLVGQEPHQRLRDGQPQRRHRSSCCAVRNTRTRS